MRVAFILWASACPGLQLYLFRRRYSDLIRNHLEGPTGFRELLAPLVAAGQVELVELEVRFKNGSRIFLCHCAHEKDLENYRGAEFGVLGIEEATQFTEFMIRFLRSRVRAPLEWLNKLPPEYRSMFPRVLYTSNPGGVGHAYFKRWFIDVCAPGEIWTTPDGEGGFTRQFIPAKLTDNPSINPEEYRKQLRGLGSPEMVRALEEGDWSAIVGAYFSNFRRDKHVCERLIIPDHLFKFRGFDWGSYRPFAVLWFAKSDGQPMKTVSGKVVRFPRGCLIVYREWYGCIPGEADKGIAMRNEDIAEGIKRRTTEKVHPDVVTDSLPFQDRGGVTIAEVFRQHGIELLQGDTSRIPGWSQVYSAMEGNEEGTMLVVQEDCTHLIRTLPALQRDLHKSEDIDTDQEDHAADVLRLGCMARAMIKDAEKPPRNDVVLEQPVVSDILKRHFEARRREEFG